MDAVVNLVGILHEARRRRPSSACHVELPRKVAEACRAAGVQHLLHMSALGASPSGPERLPALQGARARRRCAQRAGSAAGHDLPALGDLRRGRPLPQPLRARWCALFPGDPARRRATRASSRSGSRTSRAASPTRSATRAPSAQAYELCGPEVYTLRSSCASSRATLGQRARDRARCPAALATPAGVRARAPARQAHDARQPALDERGQRLRRPLPRRLRLPARARSRRSCPSTSRARRRARATTRYRHYAGRR